QPPPKKRKRRKDHQNPPFDLRSELQRMSGVDVTRIDGIDAMTGQTVISEVGLDMSRWPSEQHFTSWLGLCPSNELSGGRILKKRTRQVVNRAATAFRIAASNLLRASQSYLGAKFRRLRARLGPPRASPPGPVLWPSFSTSCSNSDRITWIVGRNSMSKGSASSNGIT
ncbi:MAG: transposase, partial [Bryobacteraceae bacterium]